MASGVVTSMGYPLEILGGITNKNKYYYNQEALTSPYPYFVDNRFVSPIDKKYLMEYGKSRKNCKNLSISECREFHRNPKVNPRTYKKINSRSTTYNNIVRECGTPKKKRITKANCVKFIESGMKINPSTGRSIAPNGPLYRKYIDKCKYYSNNVLNTSTSETQTEQFSNNVPSFFIGNKPEIPEDRFDFYVKTNNNTDNQSESSYRGSQGNNTIRSNQNTQSVQNNNQTVLTSEFNGIEISVVPQTSIQFDNGNNIKTFKVFDYAMISNTGDKGRITNIGPKFILLDRGNGLKQRRLKHTDFVLLNSQ